MKTYLKEKSEALFRENRFVFNQGEAPAKGPENDNKKEAENPQQALEKKTGMSAVEIKKYQDDYKLQDLQHKLGTEFVNNPDSYNPAKLLAKLAGTLEKSKNEFGEGKAAYDKKAAEYLKNVEFNDKNGKINLTSEQIATKGVAFAGLFEDLGQDEKRLLSSLDNRQLVESVMSKLETASGSVPAVERSTRYEASLTFLQQQRAMMEASMKKLGGEKPLELVEKAKTQLERRAWMAIDAGEKQVMAEAKARWDTDHKAAILASGSEVQKAKNDYLQDFWKSLNPNEKAVLQYNDSQDFEKISHNNNGGNEKVYPGGEYIDWNTRKIINQEPEIRQRPYDN